MRSIDRFRTVWWLGALAGLASVPVVILPTAPAEAQDFCGAGSEGSIDSCPGPIVSPTADISGSAQRQIQQRLHFLRCEGVDDPACAGAGGAAADSVSYEGLGAFLSGEYQFKDKKNTGIEMGYKSNSFGPTLGMDYRIGTAGVVGAAFDFDHTTGDFDSNFGDFTTDTFTGILYGSYYPTEQSYIDAALGFGHKEFETDHDAFPGGGPSVVNSETTGFDFTADLSGGYDFTFESVTVGPRVGIHYKRTSLDSFTETGVGTLFHYEDQVDESLTGTIGAQASMAFSTSFGVVVPQVSAEYVREFLDDRERHTAQPVGGVPFTFVTDQPDRNHFNLGAGVVFVLPEGITPFVNYAAEVANSLEETHTVSAGARFGF